MIKHIITLLAAAMTVAACSRDYIDDVRNEYGNLGTTPSDGNDDGDNDDDNTKFDSTLVMGADISLLPTYEAASVKYCDTLGNVVADATTLFADAKMNTMRIRLFVNPENDTDPEVVQDLTYVKSLCKRLVEKGFNIMLDFHYSDTWADPVRQTKPAAWSELSYADLVTNVYTYTTDCLKELKAEGVEPTHIQVGNEITSGMIWNDGKIGYSSDSNWDKFAELFNSGAKACREQCPNAKIILHTERPGNLNLQTQFYQRVAKYKFDFDIIGLSYYPIWSGHGNIEAFDKTLTYFEQTYPNKPVMICEFSYNYAWYPADAEFDYTSLYPATPAGQAAITRDLITMLRTHQNVTGLFWWFAEENEHNDASYTGILDGWFNRGLFDNQTGKALPALYQLQNFLKK